MNRFEATRIASLKAPWGVGFADALTYAKTRHRDLYYFHEGEFDLAVPQPIIDATNNALDSGKTRYDEVKGLRVLRERICEKLIIEDGVCADPEEILITNGSSQAIFEFFLCYVSPGDKVLIPNPCWPTYEQGIRMAGGIPVEYPCNESEIDIANLRRLVLNGAKIIVINSPHNPTGVVLSKYTIDCLIELAIEFDLLLLSDEAYDGLLNIEIQRITPLKVSNGRGVSLVTTRSFSKSYSMTGYRIGYMYACKEIVERCAMLHAHLSDNVCTFAQYGALAALDLPKEVMANRLMILQNRLNTAYEAFSKFFPCQKPQGGFYLFPSIAEFLGDKCVDSKSFATKLLQETGVATVAGESFGSRGYLRLSVAAIEENKIIQAAKLISVFASR